MNSKIVDTPIGRLQIVTSHGVLHAIGLPGLHRELPRGTDALLERTQAQLAEYFAGRRRRFDLPLAVAGTAFQRQVWQALAEIPFGETWSYAELARHIGRDKAVRAVGLANGANPLPIVLPCHRVIGSDGALRGYAGGLATKQWLLDHERSPALFAQMRPASSSFSTAVR